MLAVGTFMARGLISPCGTVFSDTLDAAAWVSLRAFGKAEYEHGYWVATINETIDASVFKRWQANPKYRPEGLTVWTARVSFDLAKAQGDVRADDPVLPLKR